MTLPFSSSEGVSLGRVERFGGALAGGALVAFGLFRRTLEGALVAFAGGALLLVSLRRRRESAFGSRAGTSGIRVTQAITVDRSPAELYSFWKDFGNLPRIMPHLESVRPLDGKRTRWIANGPAGVRIVWDAEVVRDIENELIVWQSLEDADVPNAGSVAFNALPDGRGTEVKVVLRYDPPGGRAGAAFAKLFGEDPALRVAEDLTRLKQIMETGEMAAVEGQASGRPVGPSSAPGRAGL
jgi:uncharacterized membrane protein